MRRKLKEVEEMWNTNEGKYLVKVKSFMTEDA